MGQFIEYGATIQKEGIDKFDCAENVTVKAMLLNYSHPYARNLAYDDVVKRSVECTDGMALKYGLNPKPRYFFLVAKFTTDMNGNILGDKEEKVTFMSMSDNQYNHFLAASNNLDKWNGFVTLTKVVKKGNGKDLSYIDATPASSNSQGFKGLSDALIKRISELVKNDAFIKKAIDMVDLVTGLYEDKYVELLNQVKSQNNGTQQAVGQGGAQPQGNTMYVTSQPAPQAIPQSAPTNNVADADVQAVEGEIAPVEDLPF